MIQPRSFSESADAMRGPADLFSSPAFARARWAATLIGHDERMRFFTRKLLRRLDGMSMPFHVEAGCMTPAVARQRYVTGTDPWLPMESPFLDGTAVGFRHVLREPDPKGWVLFAEVGFDVANLAQIPVMWGGFAATKMPGVWRLYDGCEPDNWRVDDRTYTVRKRGKLDYEWG